MPDQPDTAALPNPPDRLVTYAEAVERTRHHEREAKRHEQEARRWALIAERKR